MTGAICIASGPSLTEDDLELCRKSERIVYIVNDVHNLAPWADILYAADADWWDYHEGVTKFKGQRWGNDPRCCKRWGLNLVTGTSKKVFATEEPIAYGGNSGFQIINLAYIHGHRDIWLLGYDMGYEDKKHFFGEHPQKINRTSNYKDWIERFNKAKPIMDELGLRVTNMTRKTNLDTFPKGELCAS